MKDLTFILSTGIRKNKFYSIVMIVMFLTQAFIFSNEFVLDKFMLIFIIFVVAIIEIITILNNKKISGTLIWFAEKYKDLGRVAWTSWQISHTITLVVVTSAVILYQLLKVGSPLVEVISFFVWISLYLSVITRTFFNEYVHFAQEELLKHLRKELDEIIKRKKNG